MAEGTEFALPGFRRIMQHRAGRSAGAVRVSLGIVSVPADVERFARFAAGFRDQTTLAIGAAAIDVESRRVIRGGSWFRVRQFGPKCFFDREA